MSSAYETLSHSLLPWLETSFERFDEARRGGHLGHAWLLSGPAGAGKINLALALAARLLGRAERPARLEAKPALAAMAERHALVDRHPDLHWLYPEEEKETISVEQVRDVIGSLALTAHQGTTKVVIIEPAEALTTAASNALLKTLEEPTADSYLLLVAHRPGRLPATVRSRCQHLKLRLPPIAETARWLGGAIAEVEQAASLVGRSPLTIAMTIIDVAFNVKEIERSLIQVCEDRSDCQTLAQAWTKSGAGQPLSWLLGRLHEEIRFRLAPGVSTGVTVPPAPTLHNAWRGLSTRSLVDAYDRSEKLLNQLGSGLNMELAIQALLSDFQTNRGRS